MVETYYLNITYSQLLMSRILVHDIFSLMKVLKSMSEKPFKSTAGDGGDTVALTNVKNEHFPKIRDWIKEFFRKYYQKQCFDGKQVG